jgi:hypothetical protein
VLVLGVRTTRSDTNLHRPVLPLATLIFFTNGTPVTAHSLRYITLYARHRPAGGRRRGTPSSTPGFFTLSADSEREGRRRNTSRSRSRSQSPGAGASSSSQALAGHSLAALSESVATTPM